MSWLVAIYNSNYLNFVEKESIAILLVAAPKSSLCCLDSELKALLNSNDRIKRDSFSRLVVSELLRCSLVPETDGVSTFFTDIWRHCSRVLQPDVAHIGPKDFLYMVLLHTLPDRELSNNPSQFPSAVMLDLWVLLAGNLTTKLATKCCLRLEDHLAKLFKAMDASTWTLYQRVCSLTPHVFVNLCIETLLKRKEFSNCHSSHLLSSVLEYDCSNFSCLIRMFTSIDSDDRMAELWNRGWLDQVAATFVLQTSKQPGARGMVATQPFVLVAGIIARRFLTLLEVSCCQL